jgi:NAD(P)-dependent dehydrogenase (short-subunit alcohol dehydrogenase family)
LRFLEKTVIVTGGGTGIGKETALLFAEGGANVLITGRRENKLLETDSEAREHGYDLDYMVADVSDERDYIAVVSYTIEKFGQVDILFNNAGVLHAGLTHETPTDVWDRTFEINVRGTWLMSKYVILRMLERERGWIVNNASVVGLKGFPALAAYTASKGAVVQLTRSMALEYAARGIKVNAVCPGTTVNPLLTDGYLKRVPDEAEGLELMKSLQPMGRLASAREIANAVLFLCDENSGFITGHMLAVDGGWCAK